MRLENVYVAPSATSKENQNKNRQRGDLKMKTTDSDCNLLFDGFVTQAKREYFKHKCQVVFVLKMLDKLYIFIFRCAQKNERYLILVREANQNNGMVME